MAPTSSGIHPLATSPFEGILHKKFIHKMGLYFGGLKTILAKIFMEDGHFCGGFGLKSAIYPKK